MEPIVQGCAPQVTVLMPVYNGNRFLREAIESILNQTFTDFEFLIIDDGSTDNSVETISSYADPRIRLVRNVTNIGVARTLNKGIGLARGDYIARMDADDVSLPRRIEIQLSFMKENPETDVLATRVALIDAKGNDQGSWEADHTATTHDEIRRRLPDSNCIAHPTVMMRRSIASRYGYREDQLHAEDYDLWLRLTADNLKIEKIGDPLLRYRVHTKSITFASNATAYGVKDVSAKSRYLLHRLTVRKRPSLFDARVAGALTMEFGRLTVATFDRLLRATAKHALIRIGSFASLLAPRQTGTSLFFFFPFYHVGGAERVHADIIAAVAEERPWVIITHASKSRDHREFLRKNSRLCEISPLLNGAITKYVCLGFCAALINRQTRPRAFGSNTPFFYELLPWLGRHVECIDLLHAFGGGLDAVSLPYVPRLNRRVVICSKTYADLKEQYASHDFGPEILERVTIIGNAVHIPASPCRKDRERELKVLYVGRGSEEKRVYLVGRIAELCHRRQLPVHFTLVGDVATSIEPRHLELCTLAGEISDPGELERYYRQSDMLLVTSRMEGFPMVVMEGMAHGVVPVSTDVGGIPEHVTHGVNGFLVANAEDTESIVESFVGLISTLACNRRLLEEMAERAYHYAAEHFRLEKFNRSYRELLLDATWKR